MRHRSGQRKLNITSGAHRIAMMRNMSNALIQHERIKVTLIRGKELRRFVEPLITLSKKPTVANRRLAFSRLRDRNSVQKLFDDLGIRFANRPGGYLRLLKYGFRAGDKAPMALLELVERKEEEATETTTASEKKPAKTKAATAAEVEQETAAEESTEETTETTSEETTDTAASETSDK